MKKNYEDITDDIRGGIGALRKEIPDVLQGFNTLSSAAIQKGALDPKTKELIALALGVAAHCDGCIGFHTQALVRLGATRAEVAEALGTAIYMGGGPNLMYASDALRAFEEAEAKQAAA
jgi:AhpD family alkylhydroperoxidase